jgi:hypothetical protein
LLPGDRGRTLSEPEQPASLRRLGGWPPLHGVGWHVPLCFPKRMQPKHVLDEKLRCGRPRDRFGQRRGGRPGSSLGAAGSRRLRGGCDRLLGGNLCRRREWRGRRNRSGDHAGRTSRWRRVKHRRKRNARRGRRLRRTAVRRQIARDAEVEPRRESNARGRGGLVAWCQPARQSRYGLGHHRGVLARKDFDVLEVLSQRPPALRRSDRP